MTELSVNLRESRRRFSIAGLMYFVLVVAIDFTIYRFHMFFQFILPLLSLLFLGLPRLRKGQATRPFWIGFQIVGWPMIGLSVLLYQAYMKLDWDFLIYPASWLGTTWVPKYGLSFTLACAIALYGGPQLLAATFAGWLSSRYRMVRRRPVDRGLLEEMVR